MKVRITSRSGGINPDPVEVPDDLEGFLKWAATQGIVVVVPPGQEVRDPSWGDYDADPDRWTVHMIDEYD